MACRTCVTIGLNPLTLQASWITTKPCRQTTTSYCRRRRRRRRRRQNSQRLLRQVLVQHWMLRRMRSNSQQLLRQVLVQHWMLSSTRPQCWLLLPQSSTRPQSLLLVLLNSTRPQCSRLLNQSSTRPLSLLRAHHQKDTPPRRQSRKCASPKPTPGTFRKPAPRSSCPDVHPRPWSGFV